MKESRGMEDVEIDLWKRYREGDEAARKALILAYLPLVDVQAKRLARITGADWQDLKQDGSIGLIRAVARFDPNRGVPFKFFAKPYICGAIYDSSALTRDLARRQEEIYRKVRQEEAELIQTLGRNPTIGEIAERAELTTEQIRSALDARALLIAEAIPASEETLNSESILTVEQIINAIDARALAFADDTPPSTRLVVQGTRDGFDRLKALFESGELSDKLGVIVKGIQWKDPQPQKRSIQIQDLPFKLSAREKLVIYEFYWAGRSDQEIAKYYGLTVSDVARNRRRAIGKLRNRLERRRAT